MSQDSYTSSKLMLFSPLLGLPHTPGIGQLRFLPALSGVLYLPAHTALLAQSRKPLVSLTGCPSCPTGQGVSLRYNTGRAPPLVLPPPTHSLECRLLCLLRGLCKLQVTHLMMRSTAQWVSAAFHPWLHRGSWYTWKITLFKVYISSEIILSGCGRSLKQEQR